MEDRRKEKRDMSVDRREPSNMEPRTKADYYAYLRRLVRRLRREK